MTFNSWEFLIFFAAFYAAYVRLRVKSQNLLILAASYFFYGWWDWRFTSLLAISTIVDFSVSHRMPGSSLQKRRRLLGISLVTNLGILGFFKYFNFFADSAASVLGGLGLEADFVTLQIILPVGISFYTFQTLAYTIDVMRGKIEPEYDLVAFAVYVSYFPQLVAGPIERAQHLLPQIKSQRRVSSDARWQGLTLVLIGLVRKVAVADFVAPIVSDAFSQPGQATGVGVLAAVFAFALQIYGDFAGYSNIARGISRMMGIELMRNFRHPYFATSITDFWRRWHISLSSWLRDYLYIPLGGNRHGALRQYRNLALTMLLGGLWHGANWTFVVWGGIHGAALAVDKLWAGIRKPALDSGMSRLTRIGGWLLTMGVVLLAWVFFRASSVAEAFHLMSSVSMPGSLPLSVLAPLLLATALLLFIDVPQYRRDRELWIDALAWFPRGLAYAGLILAVVVCRRGEDVPFIYFQF